MKYEGIYKELIRERQSFISDSIKTKSNLEFELRQFEAELKLYSECYNIHMVNKYADLKAAANDRCIKKRDEIDALNDKLNDLKYEIEVLNILINDEEIG